MDASISTKFFVGDFKGFLNETVNANPPRVTAELVPYVIGSFVFLGQLDHGLALLDKHQDSMSHDKLIQAKFFIGIGLNRAGKYQESKSIFLENLISLRKNKLKNDDASVFFVYQGLGFYYLFKSRYGLALRAAKRSRTAAIKESFLFGRILAADLLGNCYFRTGQFSESGKSLLEAQDLSQVLGNGGIADAVRVNRLVIQSIAGLDEGGDSSSLATQYKSFVESNNFSGPTLGLELARQHAVRGNINEASIVLKEVQGQLAQSKNHRQKANLNLRWAYNHFLRGDFGSAEDHLDMAYKDIDWEHDLSLALGYYGLKQKVLRAQGLDLSEAEKQTVGEFERKSQDGYHLRIVARSSDVSADALPGEDLIGDLMDQVAKEGANVRTLRAIIRSGCLSIARDLFRIPSGAKVFVADALPGQHLVFDKGQVTLLEGALTPVNRDLLRFLSTGMRSTADIVKELWGVNYDPMRHNSAFYSAISRLRAFLGEYRHWVVGDRGLYALEDGVRIQFESMSSVQTTVDGEMGGASGARIQTTDYHLNLRQIKIMDEVRKSKHVTNRIVQDLHDVSYATATRDLTALTKAGLLQKVGRGKATSYLLATAPKANEMPTLSI